MDHAEGAEAQRKQERKEGRKEGNKERNKEGNKEGKKSPKKRHPSHKSLRVGHPQRRADRFCECDTSENSGLKNNFGDMENK